MQTTIDIPQFVRIPTSELGKDGVVGRVIEIWRNRVKVQFGDAIGIYTIAKHVIEDAG